jgi:hypothetical protein
LPEDADEVEHYAIAVPARAAAGRFAETDTRNIERRMLSRRRRCPSTGLGCMFGYGTGYQAAKRSRLQRVAAMRTFCGREIGEVFGIAAEQ